jgi:hypothetical protein
VDGPYKILKRLSDITYKIQRNKRKPKIVHVDRLKPYYGRQSIDRAHHGGTCEVLEPEISGQVLFLSESEDSDVEIHLTGKDKMGNHVILEGAPDHMGRARDFCPVLANHGQVGSCGSTSDVLQIANKEDSLECALQDLKCVHDAEALSGSTSQPDLRRSTRTRKTPNRLEY